MSSLITAILLSTVTPTTTTVPTDPPKVVRHCQVPCGIYSDMMRIERIREDVATIRKAMAEITELSKDSANNMNQLIRWVTAKEEHAQHIQDMVAAYWLTQRIKAPKDDSVESRNKYLSQLAMMHQLTVSAMKTKQTTDAAHCDQILQTVEQFIPTYFSKEDLEHLKTHKEDHGK